ncbi:hypothetical protein JTB14_034671 [Gonioctena quinquepunctata]|nr:hypothetical protein JTB14_034671 [Gonioctena quinquepunctata]
MIEETSEVHYIGVFPENKNKSRLAERNFPPRCFLKTSEFIYKNEKGLIVGYPISRMQVQKLNIKKVYLNKLHELQLEEKTQLPQDFISLHADHSQ